MRGNGGVMQPMSHDAHKRDTTSEQWVEKAKIRPDVYNEAGDQWAVLRHEMEADEVPFQGERTRANWDQRNTEEEEGAVAQVLDEALSRAQPQVDIVVVGVGGGGMNAINRMIAAR